MLQVPRLYIMAVLCPHLHSFVLHVLKKQDNKRFQRGQLLANPMLAPPHAKSTGIGPASFVSINHATWASQASASSKLTAQLYLAIHKRHLHSVCRIISCAS